MNRLEKSGAAVLVTSCPRCASMFKGITDSPNRVLDLAEAFAEVLDA